VLGYGTSAVMAQWPSFPSFALFSQKYACRRSLYASNGVAPFVTVYENWRHLRAGAQFGATGLGNPYTLLDGGFTWTWRH